MRAPTTSDSTWAADKREAESSSLGASLSIYFTTESHSLDHKVNALKVVGYEILNEIAFFIFVRVRTHTYIHTHTRSPVKDFLGLSSY